MKLNSKRTGIMVVVILIISIIIGFSYQQVADAIDRVRYPRPETEYYVSSSEKMALNSIVEKYASHYGVPEYIVYSIIRTESSFNENAVSSSGAIGLMQLKPSTFEWLLTKTGEELTSDTIYSPHVNVKYGVYYLSYLYVLFGDWDLVICAYNAGQGNVAEWLQEESNVDEDGKLISIPREETRSYFKKVKNAIEIYRRLYYSY